MNTFFKSLLIHLLLITNLSAQTNKEIAWSKAKEAAILMDSGKFEESRKLLIEGQKLDPTDYTYPYEIGYSYYLAKDYETAITQFEKAAEYSIVSAELYQLWGNAYDIVGKAQKAIDIYNLGLKKFPKAGKLYLEIGNVYSDRVSKEEGIKYYEKGIEINPTFTSNYYRAALYYLNTPEQVWGMIYGEIFMNLESNSKRAIEISKMLFDTYKTQIKIKNENESSVDFCTKMTMSLDQPERMPFCLTYGATLILGIDKDVKTIDLESLNRIRKKFIVNYFFMKRNEMHPNILFDYLKKVDENGHLEAYNYWLLQKGDTVEFAKWKIGHLDEWSKFLSWSEQNALTLNDQHKFYQNQY